MCKHDIRYELLNRLKAENCFWSYNESSWDKTTDEQLIEKTLLYLDLQDIEKLFAIYGHNHVKRVWLNRLVPQGEYLYTLNRFFAWYYFHVKNPDCYLKTQTTRYYNRMLS